MKKTIRHFSASLCVIFCLSATATNQFALIGDCGRAGDSLDRLQSSITKTGIKSLVLPGDNLYEGTYESTWNPWKLAGFFFDLVAIGNHNAGYKNEVSYFKMPDEYYSKVIEGTRFIILNSDNVWNASKQIDWLDGQLSSATENLIFLVYHHPTFTVTNSHFWFEKPIFQKKMRKIFSKYADRITAVIVGHDHISSFVDFGPIPAIVAGSGRVVREESPVSYEQDGFQVETRFLAETTPHWGLLEVDSSTSSAKVSFIRVSDQQNVCSAQLSNGQMILDEACKAAF